MTKKVKSLVPSLGFANSPIGTILEVSDKTAKRLIDSGKAELFQEKATQPEKSPEVPLDEKPISKMKLKELQAYAKEMGIAGRTTKTKTQLLRMIRDERRRLREEEAKKDVHLSRGRQERNDAASAEDHGRTDREGDSEGTELD